MGAVADDSTSSKRRPSSGRLKKKVKISVILQRIVWSLRVNGEAEKNFFSQNLLKYANFHILMQKVS